MLFYLMQTSLPYLAELETTFVEVHFVIKNLHIICQNKASLKSHWYILCIAVFIHVESRDWRLHN